MRIQFIFITNMMSSCILVTFDELPCACGSCSQLIKKLRRKSKCKYKCWALKLWVEQLKRRQKSKQLQARADLPDAEDELQLLDPGFGSVA